MALGNPIPDIGCRTSPDHETTGWPPGVPYIIGNEGCERFSFYGMKAILYVHLTSLFVLAGQVEGLAKNHATEVVHTFIAGVYAFPVIGAILADRLLGKYRTILWLSLVYCAGHAVMSFSDFFIAEDRAEDRLLLSYVGLALIAIGSGGIKPCVSANVGDQFGRNNWFRVRTVFQAFYFIINFGSFLATLLIPWTKEIFGAGVAFGIPGILMALATGIFWLGRRNFVHVPPQPAGILGLLDALSASLLFVPLGLFLFADASNLSVKAAIGVAGFVAGLAVFGVRQRRAPDDGFLAMMFVTLFQRGEATRAGARLPAAEQAHPLARHAFWAPALHRFGGTATEGPVAVLKVISVFFLVSVFWALFDQHSSSWIRQAEMMNLQVTEGLTLLPSQLPGLNPLMVMVLIPLMNLVYRLVEQLGVRATPLRRMTVGMGLASLSFAVVALLQERIDEAGPGQINALWQSVPYILITISEVMVSITGLEFAYTQAPRRMKSTIMSFWLLAVAFGNKLVVVVAGLEGLGLAEFFWVFAGLMAVAALLFGARAAFYTPKDYAQD